MFLKALPCWNGVVICWLISHTPSIILIADPSTAAELFTYIILNSSTINSEHKHLVLPLRTLYYNVPILIQMLTACCYCWCWVLYWWQTVFPNFTSQIVISKPANRQWMGGKWETITCPKKEGVKPHISHSFFFCLLYYIYFPRWMTTNWRRTKSAVLFCRCPRK